MATLEELERQAQAASRKRVLTAVIALLVVGASATTAWWLFPDVIGAVIASATGGIAPADARAARELVDASETLARELHAHRRRAFAPVVAGQLGPRPDRGACPLTIEPLGPHAVFPERARAYDSLHEHVGDSPVAAQLETTAFAVREALAADRAEQLASYDLELLRAADSAPPQDFTLILDVADHGAVAGDTYEAGRYAGTLYVYDAASRSVPCAARFDVRSSAVVTSLRMGSEGMDAVSAAMAVQRDLQTNAVAQALGQLVRTGPPP